MSIYDEDWGEVTTPRRVTLAEQEQTGLTRRQPQPVRAYRSGDVSMAEEGLLRGAVNAAGEMMAHRQMTHIVRSDDTAVTHAQASLLYSLAYIGVFALITIGIVSMAIYLFDGGHQFFWLAGLIGWGYVSLRYLHHNREQGLHHSSSGIAHAEIESREAIAIHAIDAHIDYLKWKAKHDAD